MPNRRFAPTFTDIDLLFCLANHVRQQVDKGLEHDGLNVSQVQVLRFIGQHSADNQRCIASDVSERIGLPKATIQNILAKLKKSKLVENKAPDAWGANGRNRPLRLTPLGEAKLSDASETWTHATDRALGFLDDEKLRQLSDALRGFQDTPRRMKRLLELEEMKAWKYMP